MALPPRWRRGLFFLGNGESISVITRILRQLADTNGQALSHYHIVPLTFP
jgi:hypothetical protein